MRVNSRTSHCLAPVSRRRGRGGRGTLLFVAPPVRRRKGHCPFSAPRCVQFVMLFPHCAILVVLLYIQHEPDWATLARDLRRTFHETVRAEECSNQGSLLRGVSRSVYGVYHGIFAVHVLRVRSYGG